MTTKLLNPEAKNTKHAYDIEANIGHVMAGNIVTVTVWANNRTQAAAVARRHGYTVRSVNMVG